MSMTVALGTAGATAIGAGSVAVFTKPSAPRYRITKRIRSDGIWEYKGYYRVQERFFGMWRTIHRVRVRSDYANEVEKCFIRAKLWLKTYLDDGSGLDRGHIPFDSKYDGFEALG